MRLDLTPMISNIASILSIRLMVRRDSSVAMWRVGWLKIIIQMTCCLFWAVTNNSRQVSLSMSKAFKGEWEEKKKGKKGWSRVEIMFVVQSQGHVLTPKVITFWQRYNTDTYRAKPNHLTNFENLNLKIKFVIESKL